jgi:hypothetical protein
MKTLCLLDNRFITFNDISELRTLVCYWNLSVNILKKNAVAQWFWKKIFHIQLPF